MTIYYTEEGALKLPLDSEEIAEKVVEAALDYINCPYEAQVNLLLTTNEEIHDLNRRFRDTDRPTDVLSFPMIDYEEPGNFDFLENDEEAFDPDTGELMLGDIVISKEKVVEQAEEYGHTLLREYSFLIAHSVLHLAGYDHIEEEDRIRMEEKQKDIMKILNILR